MLVPRPLTRTAAVLGATVLGATVLGTAVLGTTGLSATVGLSSASAAVPPPAVTPILSITPTSGPPGTVVTMTFGPGLGGCDIPVFGPAPGNNSTSAGTSDIAGGACQPFQGDGGTARFVIPRTTSNPSVPTPPGSYQFGMASDITNNPATLVKVSVPFTVTAAPSSAAVGLAPTADGKGYWVAEADGNVLAYGDAASYGSLAGDGITPTTQITGIAATPDGGGYWLVAADGGVFSFGDAPYFGAGDGAVTGEGGVNNGPYIPTPISGIAPTPDGQGYWLVDSLDGTTTGFGDAQVFVGAAALPLNHAVVGIATGPHGFWTVATDGGVFSNDDVAFYGSMGGQPLTQPAVGLAADPATGGYWEVATDGGVFAFHAPFFGSTGAMTLNEPIVGLAPTPDGGGYWLLGADGGVFAFGDAGYYGSAAS